MATRVALCILFGLLFLLPIAFWLLLKSYYGYIPAEATLFGMNLRVVLVVMSGGGLFGVLATILSAGLKRKR